MCRPSLTIWRPLLLLTSILAMSACSPSRDYADIEAFMDEVDARPRGRIEPLPPIETVPPFSYVVSNKRSPFEPPAIVKRVDRRGGPQVTPDFNRVKQFLEQFPIAQLSMVGTLAQNGTTFALVQDADGGVHRVQRGDYMGNDHGKIEGVNETNIDLIEIVPDGTGGWVERTRSVSLAGGA
ncbi:MAG: pilus assembly protein PilP [Pseudomonadota bacterium]